MQTIDRLYVCEICSCKFAFDADVEEHRAASGHKEMIELAF